LRNQRRLGLSAAGTQACREWKEFSVGAIMWWLQTEPHGAPRRTPAVIVPHDEPLSWSDVQFGRQRQDRLRQLAAHGNQEWREEPTDHALLVVLGDFARHVGLIDRLAQVPIGQRMGRHSPQDKLTQMLVGVLAGLEYLQDFNVVGDPLVKDPAVAHSWGQASFAHYSSLSRTLAVADAETLRAVIAALDDVSRIHVENEVAWFVRTGRPLVVDVDLTGRQVSSTSTTYPGAEFGWMGDEVGKGYQAAVTSLSGGPTRRLWLSVARYGGRTHSSECLRGVVNTMEQKVGLHPRRRTDLARGRLDGLSETLAAAECEVERLAARQVALTVESATAATEATTADDAVYELVWQYRDQVRPETPHSRLAQARRRHRRAVARVHRLARSVLANDARLEQTRSRLTPLRAEHADCRKHDASLLADNAEAVCSPSFLLRLDAGFSTADNLTWLIEKGYDVLSKAHSTQTIAHLHRLIPVDAVWQRVGDNAEAVYLGAQAIADCPYPLHVLAVRYHLGQERRHTALVYYGDHPPTDDLPGWFHRYNARQIIEAAIKEGQSVFPMRRPWVRSPIGLHLQEQFSLFAANFIRWATTWAAQRVRRANRLLSEALGEVKTLVRVLAHARATLAVTGLGRVLILDDAGPYPGAIVCLAGMPVYQHVLPIFRRPGPERRSGP
jgi:hypothetical protein